MINIKVNVTVDWCCLMKAQEHPLEQTEAGERFQVFQPSLIQCELRFSTQLLIPAIKSDTNEDVAP